MKKIIYTILLTFCSFFISSQKLFSQTHAKFYMEIANGDGLPEIYVDTMTGEVTLTFANSAITSAFSNYYIYDFHQAFPTSETPWLQRIYTVECDTILLMSDVLALNDSINYPHLEEIPIPQLLFTPNDYGATFTGITQPNLDLINAKGAWDITTGSSNIIVGITDTHFDVDHEDLDGQILQVWGSNSPTVSHAFHGTHVAGLVAAKTNNGKGLSSIGFNTKLIVSSNMDANEMLKQSQAGARVLNASWGYCSYNSIDQSVYDEIYRNGTIVVSGAGNGPNRASCGGGHAYVYPASYDHVISVSSVGNKNPVGTGSASFFDVHEEIIGNPGSAHTHNDKVDICAGGYGVPSTSIVGGPDRYVEDWGTSYSSPQVAGVCALILSVNPCLNPDDVEFILKETAVDIYSISTNSNYTGLLGAGRVDAEAAVIMAQTFGQHPTITTNTTWSSEKFVKGDLVIEAGATLTITGKVRLATNGKIIVKQGGKLIVDGGHLTNSSGCKDLWRGIEVWGNSSQHQQSNYQGILVLKNNAIIENAFNAITTWNPGFWTTMGGVIEASNTTFRNNKRCVEFMAYRNFNSANSSITIRNRSFFENCNFILNKQLLGGNESVVMVTLWGVNGVRFYGCDFRNDDWIISNKDAGGIYSIDAHYIVRPSSNSPICEKYNGTRPKFSSLDYGIFASTASSDWSVMVDNCDFSGCDYGVVLSEVNDAIISYNKFSFGYYYYPPSFGNIAEGLQLIGCDNYTVEGNRFVKTFGTTNILGIRVASSGKGNNQIYRNTFEDVNLAISAHGTNRNNDIVDRGLQFLCNSMDIGVNYNFFVDPVYGKPDEGIRLYQGVQNAFGGTKRSAANTFSNTGTTLDFTNNSNFPVLYIGHGGTGNPLTVNNVHNLINNAPLLSCAADFNNCSNPFDPAYKVPFVPGYGTNNTAFELIKGQLGTSIDGGNTSTWLTIITTSTVSDSSTIKAGLLAISPYVSNEVLVALSESNILTPSSLLSVLLANPDATKNNTFLDYLENEMALPFSSPQIDLIKESWELITPRTLKQDSAALFGYKMDSCLKNLMMRYQNDTVDYQLDSIQYWLQKTNYLDGKYSLVKSYLQEKDFTNALLQLDSIELFFDLNDIEADEHANYENLVGFMEVIDDAGKTLAQLDSTEIIELEGYANASPFESGELAKNALRFWYGYEFPLINTFPQDEPEELTLPFNNTKQITDEHNALTVYPNPSSDKLYFKLLGYPSGRIKIEIYNIIGTRLIDYTDVSDLSTHEINIQSLDNGVYFYKVVLNDETISNGRVIKIK